MHNIAVSRKPQYLNLNKKHVHVWIFCLVSVIITEEECDEEEKWEQQQSWKIIKCMRDWLLYRLVWNQTRFSCFLFFALLFNFACSSPLFRWWNCSLTKTNKNKKNSIHTRTRAGRKYLHDCLLRSRVLSWVRLPLQFSQISFYLRLYFRFTFICSSAVCYCLQTIPREGKQEW